MSDGSDLGHFPERQHITDAAASRVVSLHSPRKNWELWAESHDAVICTVEEWDARNDVDMAARLIDERARLLHVAEARIAELEAEVARLRKQKLTVFLPRAEIIGPWVFVSGEVTAGVTRSDGAALLTLPAQDRYGKLGGAQ